jgi:hypothetical protein
VNAVVLDVTEQACIRHDALPRMWPAAFEPFLR